MTVDEIFDKMQEFKVAHPSVENSDILRIFNIEATLELANQTRRLADAR